MSLILSDTLGNVLALQGKMRLRYTPFGLYTPNRQQGSAFHGQWHEASNQGYLLGNGYRLYLPGLKRFAQGDAFSPFGKGGVNAYAFCSGEPVNRCDPSGEAFITAIRAFLKPKKFMRDFTASFPVDINGTLYNRAKARDAFVNQSKVVGKLFNNLRNANSEASTILIEAQRQAKDLKLYREKFLISKDYYETRLGKEGLLSDGKPVLDLDFN